MMKLTPVIKAYVYNAIEVNEKARLAQCPKKTSEYKVLWRVSTWAWWKSCICRQLFEVLIDTRKAKGLTFFILDNPNYPKHGACRGSKNTDNISSTEICLETFNPRLVGFNKEASLSLQTFTKKAPGFKKLENYLKSKKCSNASILFSRDHIKAGTTWKRIKWRLPANSPS